MSNDRLKDTLQDLHRHLATSGPIDAELQDLLQVLDRDIHHLLNRPAAANDAEEENLATRAQELSAKLAAQHPQLETILRQLANTLENLGI
jgi:hypothetical protein